MGYGYGPGWGMMGGYGGYGGYGFGLIHVVVWIVILIAIVALVVWLVRSLAGPGMQHHLPPRRSAGLEVLEERYARGEINRDEYLQKKKDILG
jgi:putative membrane protein